jgi:hypothetical protein
MPVQPQQMQASKDARMPALAEIIVGHETDAVSGKSIDNINEYEPIEEGEPKWSKAYDIDCLRLRRLGRGLRRHGAALGGYLALTIFFHWPAVRHLGSRALSDGGDGASFLWSYWSFPRAVTRLDNPFETDLLFHPIGSSLAFHTNTPLEAMVIAPLALVVGEPLAVNLALLGAVFLSGVGGYLLALHQTGSRRASFVAGVAFAFTPWVHGRLLAHHNLTHTWVLAFGLLALFMLYERPTPTRRRALTFGATVALTLLTDTYFAAFLLLSTGVVALWRWRQTFTRVMVLRLVQAAVMTTVSASPLLVSMVATVRRRDLDPLRGWGGAQIDSTDLLSWVVPSPHHRWWGTQFAPLSLEVGSGERVAYPGLIILVLGVAGAVIALRRRRGAWVALFGTFFVLSLGPFLKVNGVVGDRFELLGERFSVPLPYMAIRAVPVVNGLRIPGRFSIVAILALAVLAAFAMARLMRSRPRLSWPVSTLVLSVLIVEILPVPYRLEDRPVPVAYHSVRSHPEDSAVLEIPMQWRDGFGIIGDNTAGRDNTIFLHYATRHGKPLVNGFVARYSKKRRDALLSFPVYRQVLSLQGDLSLRDPVTFTAADLRAMDIGFVVYHRDRPLPTAFNYFSRMGLAVLADDGMVLVWKVP